MSISIHNDSLTGATAPAARADEVSRPASSSSQYANGSQSRAGDSVDISSLSQSVAAASSAQDSQQAGRVKQLTALYQSGQYHIDSAQISRAMVSQALAAGSSEIQ